MTPSPLDASAGQAHEAGHERRPRESEGFPNALPTPAT